MLVQYSAITGVMWKLVASSAHKVLKISKRYLDMLVLHLIVYSVT